MAMQACRYFVVRRILSAISGNRFFELYSGSDDQIETCGYERLVDLGEARKFRHEAGIRDEHKHFVGFAIGATPDQHGNVQRASSACRSMSTRN